MTDEILARLRPLASLVEASSEGTDLVDDIRNAVRLSNLDKLLSLFDDTELARSCLAEAAVVDLDGRFFQDAMNRVIELQVLLAIRSEERNNWQPVLTLPPFLRPYFDDQRVLETTSVLRRLVRGANESLIIASPFLDSSFASLIPGITQLLDDGGMCLLMTRDLLDVGSGGRNRTAVMTLRESVGDNGSLRVVSWEESGLGIHMKVAISDETKAYVGSANFTRGGLGQHAEVGTYVTGPSVRELARIMRTIAEGIDETRSWQAT